MNEKETIDGTIKLLDKLINEKCERIRYMKERLSEYGEWGYEDFDGTVGR